jgi:quercetin dioxygenase-like cupin family protein
MSVKEASSEETPYGRYITSDGWFVLNLADALAVRNEEKGGARYPLEPREPPFADFGARVAVLWPGEPNALYHSEGVQEGFLVLSGECTLIVEEEEQPLRQWDYFHCPADTRHIIVGAPVRGDTVPALRPPSACQPFLGDRVTGRASGLVAGHHGQEVLPLQRVQPGVDERLDGGGPGHVPQ